MSEPFATGEPRSLAEIRAHQARLHAEAEAFLDRMPTAELLAPQGEKWSPLDHLRHLVRSTAPVARALAMPRLALWLMFGRPRGPARGFAELRDAYRERLRAGVTAGRFAPPPRPVTDGEAWRREVLGRWRATAAALDRSAARWNERALDRLALPHPALGRLSVREMLLFTLYHEAHHLRLIAARRIGSREGTALPTAPDL